MSSKENKLSLIIEAKSKGSGFKDVDKSIESLNSTVGSLDKQLFKASLAAQLIGSKLVVAFDASVRAVIDFANESRKAFLKFDTSTREVFTLLPQISAEGMNEMRNQIMEVSKDMARLTSETVPAVYQAISLGIDKDNVFSAVELASKAARAGLAKLEPTLKAGQSIVNAYGEEVISLSEVYDLMFVAVRDGVTTIPELSHTLSEVTSVSGEVGVAFEDVVNAMVVMTKQGDSTAEAAGLLSTLLIQLGTSGTVASEVFQKAAGVSFRDFIASGHSLAEAMGLLQAHADKTGTALGDMLAGGSPFFRDIQAARGIMELTGHRLEDLQDQSVKTADSLGLVDDAYEKIAGSSEHALKEAAAQWDVVKLRVGESLALMQSDFTSEMIPAMESINRILVSWLGTSAEIDSIWGGMGRTISSAAEAMEIFFINRKGTVDDVLIGRMQEAQSLADVYQILNDNQKVIDDLGRTGMLLFGQDIRTNAELIEAMTPRIVQLTSSFEEYERVMEGLTGKSIVNLFTEVGFDESDIGTDEFNQWIEDYPKLASDYLFWLDHVAKSEAELAAERQEAARQTEEAARQQKAFFESQQNVQAIAEAEKLTNARLGVANSFDAEAASVARASSAYSNLVSNFFQMGSEFDISVTPEDVSKAYKDAIPLAGDLLDAQKELEGASKDKWVLSDGKWVTEAQLASQKIVEANNAISESYKRAAFEAFKAANGVSEASMGLGVQLGFISQEQADKELEIANMLAQFTALGGSAAFEGLSPTEQQETIDVLLGGYAETAEQALWIINNGGLVAQRFGEQRNAARDLRNELIALPDQVNVVVRVTQQGHVPTFPTGPAGTYTPPGDDFRDNTGQGGVGLAHGGLVSGGIPGIDSVPAMLMPGEFVLTASETRRLGLPAINQFRKPGGGSESSSPSFSFVINQYGPEQSDPYATAQTIVDLVGNSLR